MKKHLLLITTLALIAIAVVESCKKQAPINSGINTDEKLDTITSLSEMKSDKAIWNDHGTYTLVTQVVANDEEVEGIAQKNTSTCPTSFAGSARAVAKTSFATATTNTYTGFSAIRASLPTDTYMRGLGISNNSGRATQENKNVQLNSAYIYAITRESDEDLHIIIGDASSGTLTNCESSGYPSSSSSAYTSIKGVRDSIVKKFGTDFCGRSGYTIFSPPVHVTQLQGSLFYDIDHAPGTVGPSNYRPSSSWEVHPLKYLKFH